MLGHAAHVAFQSLGGVVEEAVEVRESGVEGVEGRVKVHVVHLNLECAVDVL